MYFSKCILLFVFIFAFNFVCFNCVNAEIAERKGLHSSFNQPEREITIIEGDSLWNRRKPQTAFETYTTSSSTSPYKVTTFDDFEQDTKFSTSALKQFLDSYAEKIKMEKYRNATETPNLPSEEKEETKDKKSWNLMNSQRHKHPFEDQNGWVSLEPIPWSVSHVSKWRNKHKPTEFSYNIPLEDIPVESDVEVSTVSDTLQNYQKYKYPVSLNDYQIISPNANNFDKIKHRYRKPVVHKPQNTLMDNYNNIIQKHNNVYNEQPLHNFGNIRHRNVLNTGNTIFADRLSTNLGDLQKQSDAGSGNIIITDGLPPDFPKTDVDYNRRQGTELYSETHPFTGNGNWVLLSTSKGYKYPKKQRAIKVQPQQVDEHKSVQLTVLPPLKDSKISMTTSHGGLLQVESSLEPVEQAQKKMQKLQNLKKKRRRPMKKIKKVETVKAVSQTAPRSTDSGAVLAGVGAGLIPATMAMFVPIVMNGKKRKRRESMN